MRWFQVVTQTGKEAAVQMGVGRHQKPSLTSVEDALQLFPRTARQHLLQSQEKTETLFCSSS